MMFMMSTMAMMMTIMQVRLQVMSFFAQTVQQLSPLMIISTMFLLHNSIYNDDNDYNDDHNVNEDSYKDYHIPF